MTATLTLQDARTKLVAELKKSAEDQDARAKVLAAQQPAATQEVTDIDGELAAARAAMSQLRQELASATMQRDQHAAELALAANRKDQYRLTAAKAAAEAAVADLKGRLDLATAQAAAAWAAMSRVAADLAGGQAAASTAAAERVDLDTVVADVVQQAKAALAAGPGPADPQLVTLTGGDAMVALLRGRSERAEAVLAGHRAVAARLRAESARLSHRQAGEAPLAAAAERYDRARSAVHDAVSRARAWVIAPAPAPAAPAAPAVAPAGPSQAVLDGVAAAAKAAIAAGAVVGDVDWHAKAGALLRAEQALDAAIDSKRAEDAGYDPDADPSLKPLREAVTTARDAATAAASARNDEVSPGPPPVTKADLLQDWDLSLPTQATERALSLFADHRGVADLAGLDPQALGQEVDEAETAYATELQRDSQNTMRALDIAFRLAAETAFEGSADGLIASFVRGMSVVPR